MDYFRGMQLVDCRTYLLHNACHSLFRKGLASFKLLEELSAHSYLQDDVDVLFIVETAVKLYYVGMREEHLDFDFPQELLLNALLPHHCLLDHLQSHYEGTAALPT
jgi:hypothetical protein